MLIKSNYVCPSNPIHACYAMPRYSARTPLSQKIKDLKFKYINPPNPKVEHLKMHASSSEKNLVLSSIIRSFLHSYVCPDAIIKSIRKAIRSDPSIFIKSVFHNLIAMPLRVCIANSVPCRPRSRFLTSSSHCSVSSPDFLLLPHRLHPHLSHHHSCQTYHFRSSPSSGSTRSTRVHSHSTVRTAGAIVPC